MDAFNMKRLQKLVWELEPGRIITLNGAPVVYVARVGNARDGYALDACDADDLARKIVAMLQASELAP